MCTATSNIFNLDPPAGGFVTAVQPPLGQTHRILFYRPVEVSKHVLQNHREMCATRRTIYNHIHSIHVVIQYEEK